MGNKWFWNEYMKQLATCSIIDEDRIIKILYALNMEKC
jgi:hypothetical protein